MEYWHLKFCDSKYSSVFNILLTEGRTNLIGQPRIRLALPFLQVRRAPFHFCSPNSFTHEQTLIVTHKEAYYYCVNVSFLLLCNALAQIQRHKTKHYLVFHRPELGKLSWFLCSGSHEAEIKMAVKLGSYLKALGKTIHFQPHLGFWWTQHHAALGLSFHLLPVSHSHSLL